MIRFACPTCRTELEHPRPGDKVHCPACGQRLQVPGRPPVAHTVLAREIPPPPPAIPPDLVTVVPTEPLKVVASCYDCGADIHPGGVYRWRVKTWRMSGRLEGSGLSVGLNSHAALCQACYARRQFWWLVRLLFKLLVLVALAVAAYVYREEIAGWWARASENWSPRPPAPPGAPAP